MKLSRMQRIVLAQHQGRRSAARPRGISPAGYAANCVAAYVPKGAASLAVSYVNLANPGTYDCTLGNTPTLVAAGWSFNGTDDSLITGITPADKNFTILLRYSGFTVVADKILVGSYVSGAAIGLASFETDGTFHYKNGRYNTSDYNETSSATSGVIGLAGRKAYRDGALLGDIVGDEAVAPYADIYIGSDNNGGAWQFQLTLFSDFFLQRSSDYTSNAGRINRDGGFMSILTADHLPARLPRKRRCNPYFIDFSAMANGALGGPWTGATFEISTRS